MESTRASRSDRLQSGSAQLLYTTAVVVSWVIAIACFATFGFFYLREDPLGVMNFPRGDKIMHFLSTVALSTSFLFALAISWTPRFRPSGLAVAYLLIAIGSIGSGLELAQVTVDRTVDAGDAASNLLGVWVVAFVWLIGDRSRSGPTTSY